MSRDPDYLMRRGGLGGSCPASHVRDNASSSFWVQKGTWSVRASAESPDLGVSALGAPSAWRLLSSTNFPLLNVKA